MRKNLERGVNADTKTCERISAAMAQGNAAKSAKRISFAPVYTGVANGLLRIGKFGREQPLCRDQR
jgi:hypothetical protein